MNFATLLESCTILKEHPSPIFSVLVDSEKTCLYRSKCYNNGSGLLTIPDECIYMYIIWYLLFFAADGLDENGLQLVKLSGSIFSSSSRVVGRNCFIVCSSLKKLFNVFLLVIYEEIYVREKVPC